MKSESFVFAGMLLVLSACASAITPEERAQQVAADLYADDPRRGEEVSKLCFVSSIDGFSQATKRAVVVSEGRKDYLITTRFRCQDLEHAFGLGIDSFSSCLRSGDKLIGAESAFGHHGSGLAPQACIVDRIYEWDGKAGKDTPEAATDAGPI